MGRHETRHDNSNFQMFEVKGQRDRSVEEQPKNSSSLTTLLVRHLFILHSVSLTTVTINLNGTSKNRTPNGNVIDKKNKFYNKGNLKSTDDRRTVILESKLQQGSLSEKDEGQENQISSVKCQRWNKINRVIVNSNRTFKNEWMLDKLT